MEFRILGRLEVRGRSGELIDLGRRKQRVLLGMLLMRANHPLSSQVIVDQLWPEQQPPSAAANVQTYVAGLRRALHTEEHSPERLRTTKYGYQIRVEPSELDATVFEELVASGRELLTESSHGLAVERLTRAVGMWRGGVLEDLPIPHELQPDVVRLEDMRLVALEDSIDAQLALGHHTSLTGELGSLVRRHPLRERLWSQFMLALYRSGRQAEALDVSRALRKLLDDELGVTPSRPVVDLTQQILRSDPSLTLERDDVRDKIVPHQLPAELGVWTARDREVRRLDELLTDDEPAGDTNVTFAAITGTAGVGKTTLAVHWAHRVTDRFPDGQLHADLCGYLTDGPVEPKVVLARFLRDLGVRDDRSPDTVEEMSSVYRSVLAGRRVLVLLDNARNSDQVRPLLPGSPGCLTLITSRDRLDSLAVREGVQRLPVPVMTPEEADSMLRRNLGAGRVADDPRAAELLAERCAFLPLALRIAVSHLAYDPTMSLAGYAAQLTTGDGLMTFEIDGDAQATLRTTFDLSYRTLTPTAQRLFRYLGIGRDYGCRMSEAAAIIDRPENETRRLLDELCRAHLLELSPSGRYRMHGLLWLYAAQRCAAEDGAETCAEIVRRLIEVREHEKEASGPGSGTGPDYPYPASA